MYDSEGNVDYTERHKVFEDDPWPLLDDNQTGMHNTPAPDNQSMSLPLPDDLGNSEDQDQELEARTINVMVTPTDEDGAELSDNELDEEGFDGDNVDATPIEHVRNSPQHPQSIQLQARLTTEHSNNQLPETANPKTREGKEDQPLDHILKTKLALSVSKVLCVTPLVRTLDKSRQALHGKENYKNTYYQNLYKDTLTLVQTQVLAAQNKLSKEIKDWETEVSHQAWCCTKL